MPTNEHAGRDHKVYILNTHDLHLKVHFPCFYINFSLTPLNSYIFANKNFQTYIVQNSSDAILQHRRFTLISGNQKSDGSLSFGLDGEGMKVNFGF